MGGIVAASRRETAQSWLHNKQWDQIFILGGALLVPIPIIAFFALQSMGYSPGICEDLVTILVMVTVGGPHVFATYTRTFFNPRFRREDPGLFAGAFGVLAVVVGAVIASAFFDARVLGQPPIQLVMTFFFFWAGIHIIQQNSYFLACYAKLDKTVETHKLLHEKIGEGTRPGISVDQFGSVRLQHDFIEHVWKTLEVFVQELETALENANIL